jgi:hypothetical protein
MACVAVAVAISFQRLIGGRTSPPSEDVAEVFHGLDHKVEGDIKERTPKVKIA